MKWETKRVKDVLSCGAYAIKTGPFGSQLKGDDLLDDGNYVVYAQRNVIDNIYAEFKYCISDKKAKELRAFRVREKDILVTTRGTIGKASMVQTLFREGILHPCLMAVRLNNKVISNKYFLYILNESDLFREYVNMESNATTIGVIYSNTLANFSFPLPPLAEQQRIADYLDNKIAQIDRRIVLLEEKKEKYLLLRKSIINEAVAPKESWEMKRIKEVTKFIKSGGTPSSDNVEYYIDNGVNWVAISDMSSTEYIYETEKTLSQAGIDSKNLTVYPIGTILYSIYATLGKVSELKAPSTINQAILAMSLKKGYDKAFFKYYLQSIEDRVYSMSSSNTQPNLSAQKVANMEVKFPQLEDQHRIAAHLDKKTAQIDAITQNLTQQIARLKLLRRALINETVTNNE